MQTLDVRQVENAETSVSRFGGLAVESKAPSLITEESTGQPGRRDEPPRFLGTETWKSLKSTFIVDDRPTEVNGLQASPPKMLTELVQA